MENKTHKMKIAVICKDQKDFLNHQKSSENEYISIWYFDMAFGFDDVDSIEITNKGSQLK